MVGEKEKGRESYAFELGGGVSLCSTLSLNPAGVTCLAENEADGIRPPSRPRTAPDKQRPRLAAPRAHFLFNMTLLLQLASAHLHRK